MGFLLVFRQKMLLSRHWHTSEISFVYQNFSNLDLLKLLRSQTSPFMVEIFMVIYMVMFRKKSP